MSTAWSILYKYTTNSLLFCTNIPLTVAVSAAVVAVVAAVEVMAAVPKRKCCYLKNKNKEQEQEGEEGKKKERKKER